MDKSHAHLGDDGQVGVRWTKEGVSWFKPLLKQHSEKQKYIINYKKTTKLELEEKIITPQFEEKDK